VGARLLLEEDLRGRLRFAPEGDQLDGAVQVGLALRKALGEGDGVTGLHEDVEAPTRHPVALILMMLRDLRHRVHKFRLPAGETS
jgi:hypothetical protein